MSGHNHLHNAYKAPHVIDDPGNAADLNSSIDRTPCQIAIVTAGAEVRSLGSPAKAGLEVTLAMKTDGGNCVVTADDPINAAGNTVITFANVNDTVVLKSIESGSAYLWRVVGRDGATLS